MGACTSPDGLHLPDTTEHGVSTLTLDQFPVSRTSLAYPDLFCEELALPDLSMWVMCRQVEQRCKNALRYREDALPSLEPGKPSKQGVLVCHADVRINIHAQFLCVLLLGYLSYVCEKQTAFTGVVEDFGFVAKPDGGGHVPGLLGSDHMSPNVLKIRLRKGYIRVLDVLRLHCDNAAPACRDGHGIRFGEHGSSRKSLTGARENREDRQSIRIAFGVTHSIQVVEYQGVFIVQPTCRQIVCLAVRADVGAEEELRSVDRSESNIVHEEDSVVIDYAQLRVEGIEWSQGTIAHLGKES